MMMRPTLWMRLGNLSLLLAFFFAGSLGLASTTNYQSLISKASHALDAGKIDDAVNQAALAEKLEPNNPQTANLRGVIAVRKKDYTDAVNQFNQAIAADPKFYAAKFNLADALMLKGNYDQAHSVLEELQQVDPKSELLQFKLALAEVLAGQPDKAAALVDQMDFPGKTPAYYYARAAIWLKKGLAKDAKQYVINAHKYYTDDQCSYFAHVLEEMGLNIP